MTSNPWYVTVYVVHLHHGLERYETKMVLILLQYLKMARWWWVAVVDMKCGSAWHFDHAV